MNVFIDVVQAIARGGISSVLNLIMVIGLYTLFVSLMTVRMFLWTPSRKRKHDKLTDKARETIKYLHTHNLTEDELRLYATLTDMVDHEDCCSWGMAKEDSSGDLENECLCCTEYIKKTIEEKTEELLKKS